MCLNLDDTDSSINYVKHKYQDAHEPPDVGEFHWKGRGDGTTTALVHILSMDEEEGTICYTEYTSEPSNPIVFSRHHTSSHLPYDYEHHVTSDNCILLPAGEALTHFGTKPALATLTAPDAHRYHSYVAERQKEILIDKLRSRTSEEDSECSCPSNSEEDDSTLAGARTDVQQDHYHTANDASLFAGMGTACSGALTWSGTMRMPLS
ncbi:hypothetical protein CYMTET_48483 [Cymbomonas tetramitiformis]|uniref:Uncharacterized protein n=1 Tax=Cymbomonas tetramitiformis TaxID=36881 RepID=A0AAE0BS64_9CHLO|nr:hypothetical protein CYMTET_48483 [Cymbomonas tetramitiformis]